MVNINSFRYAFENNYKYLELFLYSFIGFITPFLIGHPQIIVGIIVNFALFMSAKNIKGMMILPVIVAPSLGVLLRGIVFGPLTIYLAYMIPFIWIGNTLLVLTFRKIKIKQSLPKMAVSAIVKSGFLFFAALLLFKLGIVPAIFLSAMGTMQLVTAILGGLLALGISKIRTTFAQ